MDWLDQNLDAYRILAEILNDLRVELRKELEKIHGAEWFRTGLPGEVFDNLVSSKEGATAIDWYETEYQQIMDFAVFPEFYQIIDHNREHLPDLLELVPSAALFQARFLELEVLRSKVGRARPISEAELSFLMTFHKRFRKQLEIHRNRASVPIQSTSEAEEVSIETIETDEIEAAVENNSKKPSATADKPDCEVTPPDDSRPPQRRATTGDQAISDTEQADQAQENDKTTSTSNGADQPTTTIGPLSQVIDSGNSTAILRILFKEVTGLAESLWSSDVPPPQTVWKEVRISTWYEENFSGLGLKPLSDFYDVISHVEEKMEKGLAKHDLQKMLEDANFAHILLAMRDMFQRNRI